GRVGGVGGGEERLWLGRGGGHHRAELVGDLLLADEEAGEPVEALLTLSLRDPLMPVDPILGEVEVLGRPLLLLPEVVELLVVEELDVPATPLLEGWIRGRAEVLPLRPGRSGLRGVLCLASLHAGSSCRSRFAFASRRQPSARTGWLASFHRARPSEHE